MDTKFFMKIIRFVIPEHVRQVLRGVSSKQMATFSLKMKARVPSLTFEQKITRKMAFDRNPMLHIYADKVKVREFVSKRVGPKYLTTSYGIYQSIKSLDGPSLPRNFVLKANHGSGGFVICWDGAPRGKKIPKDLSKTFWAKILIHPDDLDWLDLVRLSEKWMTLDYSWERGRFPEWAYEKIPPLLLAEELLLDVNGLPHDYKFQMINGECVFIQVDVSRFGDHQRNIYTKDWELIDAKTAYIQVTDLLPPPPELEEMLKVAENLSKGIDFIRVDLYAIEGRIIFGELTNYPAGGAFEIRPKTLSIELAKSWVQNY
jgi:TupA-like ATPgrasp